MILSFQLHNFGEKKRNLWRSLVNNALNLSAAYASESQFKKKLPWFEKKKALYVLLRQEMEETAYKTWVGQLILIVVSINYSAISGNYPLSCHSFPLCKMGRMVENLNLGTWSPSTATSDTCLLANTQLCSARVTYSASSQEPGGLIACSFKDL